MKKIIWSWQPDKVLEVNDKTAALLLKSKEYTLVHEDELIEIKEEEPKQEVKEAAPKPRRRRRKKTEQTKND